MLGFLRAGEGAWQLPANRQQLVAIFVFIKHRLRLKVQCVLNTSDKLQMDVLLEDVKTFFWGGGSSHGKLAKAALQKALGKSLGIRDQSCPMPRLSRKAMR